MFSLGELEAARDEVHGVFAGTPQYAWPLLAERIGTETLWFAPSFTATWCCGRHAMFRRWIG